jgi:hypothetical protein
MGVIASFMMVPGVHLNNEIQIEDRLENPGPRELACIVESSMAAVERVIFAINADIAKGSSARACEGF